MLLALVDLILVVADGRLVPSLHLLHRTLANFDVQFSHYLVLGNVLLNGRNTALARMVQTLKPTTRTRMQFVGLLDPQPKCQSPEKRLAVAWIAPKADRMPA